MSNYYPQLFSPLLLGPVEIPNRATMSAHGMGLGDDSGVISKRQTAYIEARARGGAGLVSAASLPVHESSQRFRGLQIRHADERLLPSLSDLAEAVHAVGSRLAITLWHGGYNVSWLSGSNALAPSAVPNSRGEIPKELSVEEITEIIEAYGQAADLCAQAGVDVIEVQTSSDYLLGAFLSPLLNRRTDTYGGSAERRRQLIKEVLEAVREGAGTTVAVGIRTSLAHETPGATSDYDLAQSLEVVSSFAQEKLLDFVSLSSGTYRNPEGTIPTMDQPRCELAAQSKTIRSRVDIPVLVANRIRTPDEAEALIASGCADAVAMARTWIAEPDWAMKAHQGRGDSIRPCVSCNQACTAFLAQGMRASCVVHPATGREIEFRKRPRVRNKKKILVVGGGPAGLEAARLCAGVGHKVFLHEATDQLGGALRIAATAPYRSEMGLPIKWWEKELKALGVHIEFDSKVRDAAGIEADHIIWATGSRPGWTAVWRRRPYLFEGIPGAEALPHGWDILAQGRAPKGNVAIIDEQGGWQTISLVETLAASSKVAKVTLVCADFVPGGEVLIKTRESRLVKRRLHEAGVKIFSNALVDHVDVDAIHLDDGTCLGPFDNIVLCTGESSQPVPAGVVALGDCVAPRGIWAATNDALEHTFCL